MIPVREKKFFRSIHERAKTEVEYGKKLLQRTNTKAKDVMVHSCYVNMYNCWHECDTFKKVEKNPKVKCKLEKRLPLQQQQKGMDDSFEQWIHIYILFYRREDWQWLMHHETNKEFFFLPLFWMPLKPKTI